MVQSLGIGAVRDLNEYKTKIRQGLQGKGDLGYLAGVETELRGLCAGCNGVAEILLVRLNRLGVPECEEKRRWKILQHAILSYAEHLAGGRHRRTQLPAHGVPLARHRSFLWGLSVPSCVWNAIFASRRNLS